MPRVLLSTAYKAAFENSYSSKDADQLFSDAGFQESTSAFRWLSRPEPDLHFLVSGNLFKAAPHPLECLV